jgi:hypothetical protein
MQCCCRCCCRVNDDMEGNDAILGRYYLSIIVTSHTNCAHFYIVAKQDIYEHRHRGENLPTYLQV